MQPHSCALRQKPIRITAPASAKWRPIKNAGLMQSPAHKAEYLGLLIRSDRKVQPTPSPGSLFSRTQLPLTCIGMSRTELQNRCPLF